MNRREFIGGLGCTGLAAFAGCAKIKGGTHATSIFGHHSDLEPCAPSAWTKHGVVLQPDEPWEGGFIQNLFSAAEPLDDGRWRLWYGVNQPRAAFKTIAIAEGRLGGKMTRHRAVLSSGEAEDAPLAVGNLPKGWQPVQPVHIQLHDGRHRLYFWAHDIPSRIQRFLIADSADGRRYRVLDPEHPCMFSFYDKMSAQAPPDQVSNDGITVYQLADGSFEMYVQTLLKIEEKTGPRYAAHDNLAGRLRVIDRLTSADGIRFSNRMRVLQPDEFDPPDMQFYYFTVTHTDRGRVGMLGRYPVQAQHMDLEWCFSTDGIHWRRPHRSAWVPRGRPYEPDCFTVYPSRSIVQSEGQWWLFYTGVNYTHNQKQSYGPLRSCLMWATTPSIWA